ncbi:hypothetical protein AB8A05_29915 [Tardiphaga sp. 538_B7_N1_4]|uniref:hypothetical protein n=1 Tax=Tardiphaga sp. 538_B7_N1_4 TaxID=3240778 RepID=UPI003F1F581F
MSAIKRHGSCRTSMAATFIEKQRVNTNGPLFRKPASARLTTTPASMRVSRSDVSSIHRSVGERQTRSL